MEPNRIYEACQNCFISGPAEQEISHDVYLYDEAEPLMYVCSETSMPPRSSSNIQPLRSSETLSTGIGSPEGSKTTPRKWRKPSTIVDDPEESQQNKKTSSAQSFKRASPSKGIVYEFKSQILSKFRELAVAQNSTSSNPKSDTVGATSQHGSDPRLQHNSDICIQKSQVLTASYESEKVRISSEELDDEVFSTGISDMEESHQEVSSGQRKFDERTQHSKEKMASELPNNFATRSVAKYAPANVQNSIVRANSKRIPVQGRLSPGNIRAGSPCFCLLDEIKRNNLVMKEDIFSNGPSKDGDSTIQSQKGGHSRSNLGKERSSYEESRDVPTYSSNACRTVVNAAVYVRKNSLSDAAEVYETTGSVDNKSKTQKRAGQNPSYKPIQTAEVHTSRNPDEFWRPFSPPKHYNARPKDRPKAAVKRTAHNEHAELDKKELTNERNLSAQMKDYLAAKTSSLNRRQEKYVKLPGLSEVFDQSDNLFKDIRIKDGTSFESINAFEDMSRNITNHILRMENRIDFEDEMRNTIIPNFRNSEEARGSTETKDAATDISVTLNMQNEPTKVMVDTFVQCEPHVVDSRNGVNNDHQEIMVCNDNGDGVQLYNELGHPLTDMDGYLLKDSLGRFLVKLDQYGVPITCTNGQAIFMEDSTPWDAVRDSMSIIHQAKKKPIKKQTKRGKAPSIRQLEYAMKNLKSTLDWADKISFDPTQDNTLQQFADMYTGVSPMTYPQMNVGMLKNNTSSLIAEMKSIAEIRKALLERVQFIADNKNKLEKMPGGVVKKRHLKNLQDNNADWFSSNKWQRYERPYSPTYQTMKKTRNEAARLSSPSGAGLRKAYPALGAQKVPGMDWKNHSSGESSTNAFHAGCKQPKGNQWPSLDVNPSSVENERQELDFWRRNKSTDFGSNWDHSDMKVTKDTDKAVTLRNTGEPFKGSLVGSRDEFDLRMENGWIDSKKREKSPFHTTEQARTWSETRPSIEFSSSSSQHF